MKLDKLKKQLYKPEEKSPKADLEQRLKGPSIFNLREKRKQKQLQEWQAPKPKKKIGLTLTSQQKKYFKIGGIALAGLLVILAGLFIWRWLTSFDQAKVGLEIIGAENLVSGEKVVYKVRYENNTRLELKNLKLVFYYPEDSLPEENENLVEVRPAANLLPGEAGEAEFPARLIGQKNAVKVAKAKLAYQAGGIESVFERRAEFSAKITSVPLVLAFDLPEKVVNGQSFDFSIRAINQSEVAFNDLRLRLDYPAGLNLESAQPTPFEDDNIWIFNQLLPDQEKEIHLKGILTGPAKENKTFEAWLEQRHENNWLIYNRSAEVVAIAVSPLYLDMWVNEKKDLIAFSGDKLNYKINYKNTTEVGINNVMVEVNLEGEAYDLSTLEVRNGSFSGLTNLISWDPGSLADLNYLGPGEEGELNFSVKIRDYLPINDFNDKHFSVIAKAAINSSAPPASLSDIKIDGKAQLETKIASNLVVYAKGFYYDEQMPNTGPIPPKVGEKTTYTIRWQILNSSNDVKDVVVEAILPPHVEWLGNLYPASADIRHNPNTGKVSWHLAEVKATTGILSPVKEAIFQVAITPGPPDIGSFMELLGQSNIRAHDSFAGMDYYSSDELITTKLRADSKIGASQARVVE